MALKSDRGGDYVMVPRRRGRALGRWLLFTAVVVAAAGLGFFAGLERHHDRYRQLVQVRQTLSGRLSQLRATNQSLSQQIADLKKSHSIDRQALSQARDTIEQQDSHINQLQNDVAFYKNIMAPSSSRKGLQIQRPRIRVVPGNRRYAYQVMLAQVGGEHRYIHGATVISLIGTHKGKRVVLPLKDVDRSVKHLAVKFRFRYFQALKGQFALPPDFKPERLQVVARPNGRRSGEVEKAFRWQKIMGR